MTKATKNRWLLLQALPLFIILSIAACGSDSAENRSEQGSGENNASQKALKNLIRKEPGDIRAGKLIYQKHCHYCHGRKGRGKGAVSIAVKPNPADFTRDDKRMAVTDEALYKSLSYGISKESGSQKLEKALAMPPFMGVLTPKERWDVIAYLRELVRLAKSETHEK